MKAAIMKLGDTTVEKTLPPRKKNQLQITENVGWAKEFWDNLVPLKDKVANHPIFQNMGSGELDLKKFQRGLIDFYHLVENFPKYMGLALSKIDTTSPKGHQEAKHWLIGNIKVEQNHTEWYEDWATGFGISVETLKNSKPNAYMDAVNNYLWNVGSRGTLTESLGSTNLAIEWATGEWSQKVKDGVKSYLDREIVVPNIKTMAWIKAHAVYDDIHPYEAMELIKICATTKEEQERAFNATSRALEYYIMALDEWHNNTK
jgi:pyrroloquinoline quinone (PQQ) biosynthesis protein C